MQSGQTVVLAPLRDIHCRALLLQRLQLRERQLRGCCPLLLKGSPEIPAILAAIASHKRPTQAYFRPPTVLTPLCIGHRRARSGCCSRDLRLRMVDLHDYCIWQQRLSSRAFLCPEPLPSEVRAVAHQSCEYNRD